MFILGYTPIFHGDLNTEQQYHVAPFRIVPVGVKMGLGLTGKLGRA